MIDPIIEPDELLKRINDPDIVILDASWYLPTQSRDCKTEYEQNHIPGARFFDIDKIADQDTELPHMVPLTAHFIREVEDLGISDSSNMIAYDSAGIFSSARVWWLFRIFGHANIQVLNGGLAGWVEQRLSTSTSVCDVQPGTFTARFDPSFKADMDQVRANCQKPAAQVLDARPYPRYSGQAPEPRAGLASGHIPGAISLPFPNLLDQGKMKPVEELVEIFKVHGIGSGTPVITSCGSGVTAAIINLALYRCGFGMQRLYDGSWAEWGSVSGNPVETDQA